MIEILKAILFGIVEGITEWLPISSTGHMILLDEFIRLQVSESFYEMFEVVIQLGAILAVILLFFQKLNPFAPSKAPEQKKETWQLWFKVIVAVIPSAAIGLVLDDWMDAHLYNYIVVAITLILYGVAFIVMEKYNAKHDPDSNGLLLHAVYSRRHGNGVDECNIWGCYYYMEALVRMLKGTKAYW